MQCKFTSRCKSIGIECPGIYPGWIPACAGMTVTFIVPGNNPTATLPVDEICAFTDRIFIFSVFSMACFLFFCALAPLREIFYRANEARLHVIFLATRRA